MGFGRYFMSSKFKLFAAAAGLEMETVVPPSVCLPVAVIAFFCPISIRGLSPLRRTGLIRFRVGARADDAGDFQPRRRRFHFHPNCPSVRLSVCPSGSCQSASNNRGSDFSLSGMLIPTSPEEGRTSIETAAPLGFWFTNWFEI